MSDTTIINNAATVEAIRAAALPSAQPIKHKKSVADIDAIIRERFEILDLMTQSCANGKARSLIVSGAPGLGKSFNVRKILSAYDPSEKTYSITKGYILATGLYKTLYEYRHPGCVVVMDDADKVFGNDVSVSLLKAVCDTTRGSPRVVSWKTEAKLFSEQGEPLPKSFEFDGAVIILSNIDFDKLIASRNNLSVHIQAMMSRSHYIDLELKTKLDYLVRIIQVIKEGMLDDLEPIARQDIMKYTADNYLKFRELSLRTIEKIRDIRDSHPEHWRRIANITLIKNV